MAEQETRPDWWPDWYNGKTINEPLFCEDYLKTHKLAYTERTFFTPWGQLADDDTIRSDVYRLLEPFVATALSKKVDDVIRDLRIKAMVDGMKPQTDRIHVQNGTLFLDGSFSDAQHEIVRSRFPVMYNPDAAAPAEWLKFLSELLWPEDIPTLQEYIGYCLIPSNAGQRMMLIKGSGGEGKSQIGHVLAKLFGQNMKDGSVNKISENQFARADLEFVHLMVDDDMRTDALKQTNYVKSIVTAKGKMDLERKGRQSYQGYMYARLLAFSNGDLMSLYDHSEGFYRRQLILTTRRRPEDRVDDPGLSDKLCGELEGIFLWAFEGLQRLVQNSFRFTVSDRARMNLELAKKDANNVELFMESEGYIHRGKGLMISSKQLAWVYQTWCDENAYPALKSKTMIEYLTAHQERFEIEYTNSIYNAAGRRVRGFRGISPAIRQKSYGAEEWPPIHRDESKSA